MAKEFKPDFTNLNNNDGKNPRVNVEEYYTRVSEITGISVEEIKRLNDFRFYNVKMLVKGFYKKRIHFRDFMNLTFNKKKVDKMNKEGILDSDFPELKDKLLE